MNLYVIYTEVLSTLLWMDQMKHGEGTSCRSAAKGHHIASSRAPMASGGRLWDCEILNRQLRHSYGRTSRCVPVVFPGRISILRGKKNTDSSGQRTKTYLLKKNTLHESNMAMENPPRIDNCPN